MDAGEIAAVAIAVVAASATVALVVALRSLVRTVRELRLTLERLNEQTVPLVHELRSTAAQARHDLDHIDAVLSSAESVGTTVEAASRLAYATFSNPLVKTMSLGAGVARAGRRLRQGR